MGVIEMKFDFDKWFGVIDEDNKADEYYEENEAYVYCNQCSNLMVPTGDGGYRWLYRGLLIIRV